MAPFNKPLPPSNPDVTIGYSRGRDSQRFAQDDSLQNLFTGVAKGVGDAVNLADQIVQNEIRRDITKSVDDIRSGFTSPNVTVSQATGLPADPENPTNPPSPPELKMAEDRLKTLRTAIDQGKISESSYYSQVLAETRRIRSRYPGYREQIDNITRSVVGTDPANAIVRSVFQEANKREDRAYREALRNENDLRDLQEKGLATGHEINQVRQGQKSMSWIYARVGEREEKVHFAENEKKLLAADNEKKAKNLQDLFAVNSEQITKNVLKQNDLENSRDFTAVLSRVASGGGANPEVKRRLSLMAQEISLAQRAEFDRIKRENSDLDPGALKWIEDLISFREQSWGNAISGKDEGLIALGAIESAYQNDLSEASLNSVRSNFTPQQRAFWETIAKYKEGAAIIFNGNKSSQELLKGGLADAFFAASKSLTGNKQPVAKTLEEYDNALSNKDISSAGRAAGKAALIDGVITSVTEAPQRESKEIVNALMPKNERAFSGFNQNSWSSYYNRLTSPANVNTLTPKFKEDPAVARDYAEGIKRHWSVLYKQQLDTVQGAAQADPTFRIRMDENGRLAFTSEETQRFRTGTNPLNPDFNFSDVERAVDEMNSTWDNTRNALKATGVVDQEGKDLALSLADQVITLGDGSLYTQLRGERGARNLETMLRSNPPTTFSGITPESTGVVPDGRLLNNLREVFPIFFSDNESAPVENRQHLSESLIDYLRATPDAAGPILEAIRNAGAAGAQSSPQSPPTTASGLTPEEASRRLSERPVVEPTPREVTAQSSPTSPPASGLTAEEARRIMENRGPTPPRVPTAQHSPTSPPTTFSDLTAEEARTILNERFDYPSVSNFGGRGVVADMLKEMYNQLPQRAPAKEAIESFLIDEFMMEEGRTLQGEEPFTPEQERENVKSWLRREQGT